MQLGRSCHAWTDGLTQVLGDTMSGIWQGHDGYAYAAKCANTHVQKQML